jgi:hypothetical protein
MLKLTKGGHMNKNNPFNLNDSEKREQKIQNEKFNSITQKGKVENQNQTHNSRKEGIAPINREK